MSFLDSDSSDADGGGVASKRPIELGGEGEGDPERIRINEKFAKSFETKKRAQELQAARHIDLEDSGSESESESETEDEDAEMLTPALDVQIMKTINKIRSRDPDIYDSKKEWFAGEKKEGSGGSEKNEKRMRYKDVVREQILQANTAEDVISSDDESDDGSGGERNRRNGLAYDEEQERLRKSLLGSIAEHGSGSDSGSDDDGDGLLKVRQKTAAEMAAEEEELRREAEKMKDAGDGGGEDEFLRDFVANRRWLDPDAKETPSYEEILNAPHVEDSEDEKEIDMADHFESKYNFRFEEEGGTEIAMHSRNVPGSMRRQDDKRRRERESRKQRKAEERAQKEAELRRLKNIKRAEIRRRLEVIQEMSGGALVDEGAEEGAEGGGAKGKARRIATEDLVDGDFDPEKWDAVTGEAFGDGYYQAQDADDDWKPGDDPLEGLGDLDQYNDNDPDYIDDDHAAADNGHSAENRAAGGIEGGSGGYDAEEGQGQWEGGKEEEWEGGEEEGDEGFEGMGAEKEKLLDELYKLDYEDIIGDIPCSPKHRKAYLLRYIQPESYANQCGAIIRSNFRLSLRWSRFKYTKVKASDFGLSPEEILLADDKELNKYVPLKKLAPYRKDQPKLDARRRRQLREEVKAREKAAELELEALKAAKKKRRGKKKAAAAAPSAIGATGEDESAATPAIADQLAGGKRRRRKKGQKKKRNKEEDGGAGTGEQDADMVPRVEPVAAPARDEQNGHAEPPAADDNDDANPNVPPKSGEKKASKKRRRGSEGAGKQQTEGGTESDSVAEEVGTHPADGIADKPGLIAGDEGANGSSVMSVKKTRRGARGKKGKGAGDGKNDRDGGKKGRGKSQEGGGRSAQLAATSGVSKSRLASYGLN